MPAPAASPAGSRRPLRPLVSVNGRPTAGVMKDTVVVPPFGTVEADVVADNPGATLFHCHQIIHMDYGFKRLFTYVE